MKPFPTGICHYLNGLIFVFQKRKLLVSMIFGLQKVNWNYRIMRENYL
jgi:hypothetical protein